jgi:murein DD-endopeptidase MepM/ murein hydrolase activator NlpD
LLDRKNLFVIIFLIFICLLNLPRVSKVLSISSPDIYLSSPTIPQGDLVLIRLKGVQGLQPRVTWLNKVIYLIPNQDKTDWYGFLPADLKAKPEKYPLTIEIRPSSPKKKIEIAITEKQYGVRRLTLPKKMVDLDADTLKRVRQESGEMKKLWAPPFIEPIWEGPFLRPVQGEVVGPFGRSSIINEQPRSPHSGVDLRAERGTPVKAMNSGKVVLTGDHFFTGLTVVIDHGGGIQSMYFHLDKILVQEDQKVGKGEVIGLVGSTGRATGPHLHLGVRVNGARVDPLELMTISEQIGEWGL